MSPADSRARCKELMCGVAPVGDLLPAETNRDFSPHQLDCPYSFITTVLILPNCWMSFLLTEWTLTHSTNRHDPSLSVDISHRLFLGISLARGLFNCVNTPEENFLVLLAVIWCGLGRQAAWGCRLDESHSSSIINLRLSVHCWLTGGGAKQLSSAFMMEKALQVLQAGCWLHPEHLRWVASSVALDSDSDGLAARNRPRRARAGPMTESTGQVQPLQRGGQ